MCTEACRLQQQVCALIVPIVMQVNFEEDTVVSQPNEYEVLQLLMADMRDRLTAYPGVQHTITSPLNIQQLPCWKKQLGRLCQGSLAIALLCHGPMHLCIRVSVHAYLQLCIHTSVHQRISCLSGCHQPVLSGYVLWTWPGCI